MKAIIIDDEQDSLDSLEIEIDRHCPDVNVVAACTDPRTAIDEILKHKPDILFLDIEMPHMNGFELLQKLPSLDFHVIFVTAYDQFAVRAFDFNATDYLLKPIMRAKLVQAIQKVQDQQEHKISQTQLDALLTNMQMRGMEKIALPTSDGFEFVHMNDIVYVKADSNYTWVHLQNKQKHLLTRTLKDVSGLITFPQFFRAHQSYLVNLNHVRRYVRGQGGYLLLKDNTQIPVSRANKDALMQLLKG